MGGAEDDPVVRVTGTLSGLGQQLEQIQTAIRDAADRVVPDADYELKSAPPPRPTAGDLAAVVVGGASPGVVRVGALSTFPPRRVPFLARVRGD